MLLVIFTTFLFFYSKCLNPDESFDIRFPTLDNNPYVERAPIDYTPPPPSEYCTVFQSSPDQFTFDTINQNMHMWIRKCETNCQNMKYRAGELITTSTDQKYGYYSFFLRPPNLPSISGLWVEFGLSSFGASNAVVYGIVGKSPGKGYTSTTVESQQSTTVEPDLPQDSRNGIHEYGILWNSDRIGWYFDGTVIREETDVSKIPHPSKNLGMYIDFYTHCPGGSFDLWLGPFDEEILPVSLEVSRMRYYPGVSSLVPFSAENNGSTPTPPTTGVSFFDVKNYEESGTDDGAIAAGLLVPTLLIFLLADWCCCLGVVLLAFVCVSLIVLLIVVVVAVLIIILVIVAAGGLTGAGGAFIGWQQLKPKGDGGVTMNFRGSKVLVNEELLAIDEELESGADFYKL